MYQRIFLTQRSLLTLQRSFHSLKHPRKTLLPPISSLLHQRNSISQVRSFSTSDNRQNDNMKRALGFGGLLTVLAGKTKYLLVAAKMTKFTSVISMLATTGTYAMFYGWPFAVGLVGQIFLHESGHALAMHKLGIPFGPAVFVPFMGAVIPMRGLPTNVRQEAQVAIAGPLFGTAAACGLGFAGHVYGSNLLISLADFGFMINLFNMLPIGDMDGGRISKAISKHMMLVGLGGGIYMAYSGLISNPIFYLVLLSGGFNVYSRYFGEGKYEHPSYFKVKPQERVAWTGAYFGLVAAMILLMQVNRKGMKSVRQVKQEQSGNVWVYDDRTEWEKKMDDFATDMSRGDSYFSDDSNQFEDTFSAGRYR
eukprot:maker-scaffold_6-snap-gene-14.48-mRNA-1 protein AED:0.02 eAED:0.02 QI:68/1/1/1/1/1/4/20/364